MHLSSVNYLPAVKALTFTRGHRNAQIQLFGIQYLRKSSADKGKQEATDARCTNMYFPTAFDSVTVMKWLKTYTVP